PYDGYAKVMNMTTRALYLAQFWDQSIKEVLQWASVTNTGFIRPVYRRGMAGHGHGNIEMDTFGMPSVLPSQMPANGDFQRAYCVTLMDEKPIWEAHGMFPDHQDRLKPTNSRYWYAAQIRKASQTNNARRSWWNPFRPRDRSEGAENLIPIRYSTINDLSVNASGQTMPMGEPGSPWFYEVPSFGQEIPAGTDRNGNPVFRKANANDARIYPYRRLIISSQDCVLYDGPAFNWHGELDLIPFCLDRWPWEPIGFSMVHDGYSIQNAINKIQRGTMDKIVADLDRPMAYDMNAVSKREATQVDLMQPRQRIAFDGSQVDKPFTQIAPDDVYRVSAESMEFMKYLDASLDYTLQTRDIVELGKARALGKGVDQLEALINANGPRVKDMSRAMEKSVCCMANQTKYLVLQYMDTARMIPYLNEANVPETFDYDPSSLVPSHLPGEPTTGAGEVKIESPTPRIQRARWFAQNLPFALTPHSIHELHQMTYRLALMQLRQRGAPIAWGDILESCDVPDVKRAQGNTTQERFYEEQVTELEEKVKLAKIAQGEGLDLSALMGGGGAGKKPEGRPPSGQAAPRLKQKGDGRPVVSESG
ncbi:MAG TPA: hypothetical protein VJQ82_02690, partial [Terriglobales bacterium]|nr:hypothetical protein [Terriglobales bacterium]